MAAGKGSFGKKLKTLFALAVAGGATLGGPAYYHYGTVEERQLTVEKIDKKALGVDPETRDQKYDIKIITNEGTLTNENSTLHAKFNSDDMQRKLKEGETYTIKTYGGRFDVPLFGHFYPNILSIEPALPKEEKPATPENGEKPAASTGKFVEKVVLIDGQRVTIKVPEEAADKIEIISVKPQPDAPKPQAPKP